VKVPRVVAHRRHRCRALESKRHGYGLACVDRDLSLERLVLESFPDFDANSPPGNDDFHLSRCVKEAAEIAKRPFARPIALARFRPFPGEAKR
jgi:hypothetical protein